MNIFQKTINTFKKALTPQSISYFLGKENNFGTISFSDSIQDSVLQMNYKKSLYIQAGMKRIKDSFSDIDFKLFKILNTNGDLQEIEVHEILDLLYKPNPFQTRLEFFRLMAAYFILSSEVFIRFIREEGSTKIKALMLYEPDNIDVKINEKTAKLEYHVNNSTGEKLVIQQEDMVHVKDPDTLNQLRGESTLAPIIERALVEAYGTSYQRGIFARNGNPDSVVSFENVTDPETLKQLKASFKNSFNGKNEDTRVAVVGGKIDVKQLNTGSNILDYKASQDLIRDDIMMALGVPKALVTSDDVNRANADAALQQFMQFTIAPMIKLFLEALNERFVIPNYGEEYYLGTEKLVTEDKELLIKELTLTVNGSRQITTINEARARLGLEPMEGQDTLSQFQGGLFQAPQDQAVKNLFKSRRKLYEKLKTIEKVELDARKRLFNSITNTKEFKDRYTKTIESTRDNSEKKLNKDTKRFMKAQYERILNNLDNVGDSFVSARDIFNYEQEKEAAVKDLLPTFAKITENAGNAALMPVAIMRGTQKSIKNKAEDKFILTSQTYAKIEDRAKLFSASITETTYEALSIVVSQHIHEGVAELKKALNQTFYESYIGRVDTIARTESGFMTSLGTQLAFEESTVVSGKQWLTTGDDKVRPEHVMNDRKIVDKNALFPNGEAFPAQKTINCRCVLAPVVDINNL